MEIDYYRIAQSLFNNTNYEWRRYDPACVAEVIPARI